ncbi:hypothetical protein CRG98_028464, partial [Punica granatum]
VVGAGGDEGSDVEGRVGGQGDGAALAVEGGVGAVEAAPAVDLGHLGLKLISYGISHSHSLSLYGSTRLLRSVDRVVGHGTGRMSILGRHKKSRSRPKCEQINLLGRSQQWQFKPKDKVMGNDQVRFWVLYRAKQDGPVVLGWRHPWEGHGDSHGHGSEHESSH